MRVEGVGVLDGDVARRVPRRPLALTCARKDGPARERASERESERE